MSTPHARDDSIVDALAAYRLTRLVTADVIFDRPRAWIIRNAYTWRDGSILPHNAGLHPSEWADRAESDPDAPKLAELVVCRWCSSIWCSIFVVCARRCFPRAWKLTAEMLALSSVSVLLARLED